MSVGVEDKVTSFEGILQNGVKNDSALKIENSVTDVNINQKNVLADLLERTVGGDILNGVVDKEIRLNDKDVITSNQQVKVNGPVTTNGQVSVLPQGIKRSATPDAGPVKRFALEDPQLGQDGRITLYVSHNGNESGEIVSQGGHQVVLSQGQQPAGHTQQVALNQVQQTNTTQSQVILSQNQQNTGQQNSLNSTPSQVVLSQGQQTGGSTQVVLNQNQQLAGQSQTVVVSHSATSTQTVVTPQGQMLLQRPSSQSGVLVQGGSQIIQGPATQLIQTSSGQIISASTQTPMLTSSPGGQVIAQAPGSGHVLQHVIQHGSGQPQRVILQGQLGQVLGGQVILSQSTGQPMVVQGTNNIPGQVIVQGNQTTSQGQVIVQAANSQGQVVLGNNTQGQAVVMAGNPGQTVMVPNTQGQSVVVPGTQGQQVVVSNAGGQAMILTGNHGQQILMGGQQGQPVVMSGNQQQPVVVTSGQSQGNQVVVPGNAVGGTMLLASQTPGSNSAKTLIILPNQKMVVSGGQTHAGQQVVLPRQFGQQVVQVVSANNINNAATVRTVRAGAHGAETLSVNNQGHIISSSSANPTNSSFNTAQTTIPVMSAIAPAPAGPTAVPVSQPNTPSTQSPHIPAPQVLSSGVARRTKPSGLQYLCEWRGCNQVFTSPGQVYHHACKIHCPPHITELQCQWAGCDTMTRKRFSAMTHIHDRHCNEQVIIFYHFFA